MLNIKQITSTDIPELHPYRTLRRPMDHLKEGIFVAEGAKVVRRLLDSDLTIISFLMTKEWYDELLPEGQIPFHRRNNKATTNGVSRRKRISCIDRRIQFASGNYGNCKIAATTIA